ncbi:DinB family protein [Waterburya agarophytonicola K14]|uniref:DinB family protein n=1 Tax=Waterburya agarophytonicola KI4 TaxID=2874699 RepID=A0A964BU36_9CYAN|nr:DinB family protein [Waterburya agarophytonicola]MCC0179703.1 DinB family protein [Waterburya agarophytonicola KI4]
MDLDSVQLMGKYNQWMNHKIYQAAIDLGDEKIKQDRGAFFGSIFATLNHIYIADIIWLTRFSRHPQEYQYLKSLPKLISYTDLNGSVAKNIISLFKLREELDAVIINWCQEINLIDLEQNLQYKNTKHNPYCKNFAQLVQHFFNHQTHHRGQVSTLFSQQGIDIGVTDLLEIIPDHI